MMVLAKAAPGRSEELARWYDETHIPELLAVPGMVSAERHAVMPMKGPAGLPAWDFLLIYELAGDEPLKVIAAMGERQQQMQWSDALDSASGLSLIGVSQGRRES